MLLALKITLLSQKILFWATLMPPALQNHSNHRKRKLSKSLIPNVEQKKQFLVFFWLVFANRTNDESRTHASCFDQDWPGVRWKSL
jgi:hypothetical protein